MLFVSPLKWGLQGWGRKVQSLSAPAASQLGLFRIATNFLFSKFFLFQGLNLFSLPVLQNLHLEFFVWFTSVGETERHFLPDRFGWVTVFKCVDYLYLLSHAKGKQLFPSHPTLNFRVDTVLSQLDTEDKLLFLTCCNFSWNYSIALLHWLFSRNEAQSDERSSFYSVTSDPQRSGMVWCWNCQKTSRRRNFGEQNLTQDFKLIRFLCELNQSWHLYNRCFSPFCWETDTFFMGVKSKTTGMKCPVLFTK